MRLHAEWDTYRRRTAEQREAEKALATESWCPGSFRSSTTSSAPSTTRRKTANGPVRRRESRARQVRGRALERRRAGHRSGGRGVRRAGGPSGGHGGRRERSRRDGGARCTRKVTRWDRRSCDRLWSPSPPGGRSERNRRKTRTRSKKLGSGLHVRASPLPLLEAHKQRRGFGTEP